MKDETLRAHPVTIPGDIWQLGAHRIICGDATNAEAVEALMAGEQAALCITSPPYANKRDYATCGIKDWDGLMRGVFAQLPMVFDGQVLVNLGLVHRNNEFVPYWDDWLLWMRTQGWRRFGWYVWDQGPGLPGDWVGRFAPSFEFAFHFNRKKRKPNKIVPCVSAGKTRKNVVTGGCGMRRKDGRVRKWVHIGRPVQDTRIPDSVIRIPRQNRKVGHDIDHPAVFPVALPEFAINAYTDVGDIVYEPFAGSGSTMLAAQRTGRICRCVEIVPQYVDVAIIRFRRSYPDVPVTLLASGRHYDDVAAERNSAEGAKFLSLASTESSGRLASSAIEGPV